MAKKTIDNAPLLLAKDKETLKSAVLERIELGEELAKTPVVTADEEDAFQKQFNLWNHVNYEMITTAFTVRRHMHEHEYVYHRPIDVDDIYGRRRQPSLQDEISEVRSAFSTQVQKLRHFHEMIDLQQVAPGVHPPARKKDDEDLDKLLHLLGRFHRVAQRIRDRHDGRATLEIKDEYDVQDLLYGLLQIDFDDVRPEESSPSHAGGNSRIDFVLRLPGILLEAKMTSAQLRDKKLGDELLIDIGRYKEYPGIQHFVIFIYDRGDHVSNKQGMIRDLVRHSTPQFRISVVINPS